MRSALALAAGVLTSMTLWAGAETGQTGDQPATSTAPAMPEGVDLVVVALEETRRSEPGGAQPGWTVASDLRLMLHVVGDTAAKARRVGRLKIDEAADDTGQSLLKSDTTPVVRPDRGLETIDEWKRRGVRNGFSLELHLQPAGRKAEKIARINGSFVVMVGGKPAETVVKDVTASTGKEVEDEALKAAGVRLRIDDRTEGGRQVAYVVEENEDAVVSVELVDESGKLVRSIKSTARMGDGPAVHTLGGQQGQIPAKVGLKLTLLSGAQFITVPVRLKDVPLP